MGEAELRAQRDAALGIRPCGEVGEAECHRIGRVHSRLQQHVADATLAGEQRLAPEERAQLVQRAGLLARERVGERAAAHQRGVDLRAGVVVVQDDRDVADLGQAGDGVTRVDRHEEGEVRRALGRGQAQVHVDVAGVRGDARADEAERRDRLVELRVDDARERLQRLRLQGRHAAPSTSCASSRAPAPGRSMPSGTGMP